ncbi:MULTISPECIES: DUF695 domain-containing protein [Flavobacterium]|uniref:DUF695 domain-containing protein n=1 Tax=Flavobacterium jumunjinense TaxID=998845 RepID=A0ABV5GMH4_9FLAO|nr:MULTISPECIES: DUF695 domain-containing protein [Flavobacterium]
MSLFKKIFGKNTKQTEFQINNNEDFWNWFMQNERKFHEIVKSGKNIEDLFFANLSKKLNELKEGYFFLTGMYDQDTVELIITADGNIKNIVYAEELINAAPIVDGWKFTASKPANTRESFGINMNNYTFDTDNIKFFSIINEAFPDEINITLIHNDYKIEDKEQIDLGCYIFIDNYLGELNAVSIIDKMNIIGPNETTEELISITKLKSYLIWREKEFVEKYESTKHSTENDTFTVLESTTSNGNPFIAIINTDLLKWEEKASHQWFVCVNIKYDGTQNNGFPNNETIQLLNEFEDQLDNQLKFGGGNLNLGRESSEGIRTIFYACKDFRVPSKVLTELIKKHEDSLALSFEIYKDKYWSTLNYYMDHIN